MYYKVKLLSKNGITQTSVIIAENIESAVSTALDDFFKEFPGGAAKLLSCNLVDEKSKGIEVCPLCFNFKEVTENEGQSDEKTIPCPSCVGFDDADFSGPNDPSGSGR